MREFDDLYLDELVGFARPAREKSTHKDNNVRAAQEAPMTGVHFPEGSKRIAFEVWVNCDGNFAKTIITLKKTKILGGRAPSPRTIRIWAQQGRWDVLKDMLNDGLRDFLDGTKDPNIKDAIKNDATYFAVMLKMRSSIMGEMLSPRSGLWPKRPNEALSLMKYLGDELEVYKKRAGVKTNEKGEIVPEENPDNVLNFLKEKERRDGNAPLTESDLAMEILRDERSKQQG